jgi:hypothetical protein
VAAFGPDEALTFSTSCPSRHGRAASRRIHG